MVDIAASSDLMLDTVDRRSRGGSRQVFAEAGLTEVSRPSPRRVVTRVDFTR